MELKEIKNLLLLAKSRDECSKNLAIEILYTNLEDILTQLVVRDLIDMYDKAAILRDIKPKGIGYFRFNHRIIGYIDYVMKL